MKKAVIFDLDGTLWDSSESVAAAWNTVFSRCPDIPRRITVSDMHSYMGKTLDKIAPLALPDTPEPRRSEVLWEGVRYEQEYIAQHGAKLLPNAARNAGAAPPGIRANHREQLPGRLHSVLL